jgi:hypothetical protein
MNVQRLCAANGAEQMLCSDRLPVAGASSLLQHHGYLHLCATVCRPPTPALALPLPDALHSHSPDRPSARPAGQNSDQRDRQRRPQNAGSGSGSSGGRGAAGEQAARLSSLPPSAHWARAHLWRFGGLLSKKASSALACICVHTCTLVRARAARRLCVCVCATVHSYTEGACLLVPVHGRRIFASLYVK